MDFTLRYIVHLMCKEDIPQVAEIDRQAFPTMWPPANFQRELDNKVASYIVVCNEDLTGDMFDDWDVSESGLSHLYSGIKRLFGFRNQEHTRNATNDRAYIVGFAGFWVIADEAHIINIAVRQAYQKQGLGELLLISLLDMAIEKKSDIVTLEVRVSNTSAQQLYAKYGFTEVGIRRGYYLDNKEDGALMSTEKLMSEDFQAKLHDLKRAYYEKFGDGRNFNICQ